MLKSSTTKKFDKEVSKARKQGKDTKKLVAIMELLAKNIPLPKKNCNHKLKGNFVDHWECHINSDWLLVYKKTKTEIIFERLGSHSELFK